MIQTAIILRETITLNDSQIKTLPTLRFNLLPDLGPGQLYNILGGFINFKRIADYTNVTNGGYMILLLGSECRPISARIDHYIFNNGSSQIAFLPLLSDLYNNSEYGQNQPEADFINGTLLLGCDNIGNGDFTGGDPGNELKITLFFTIENI